MGIHSKHMCSLRFRIFTIVKHDESGFRRKRSCLSRIFVLKRSISIIFHDLWNFYGRFMTVKRLFFTQGCGDGSYEKLCFHVDESALCIERPPEALRIDVFSGVVWLGCGIL